MFGKENKRKANAIKVLNKYKIDLGAITATADGNTLKADILHSLEIYFGKESPLWDRINDLSFTKVITAHQVADRYEFSPTKVARFQVAIDAAINQVNSNGLKEDYLKTNLLSQFTSGTIISGFVILVSGIYGAGYLMGGVFSDSKNEFKVDKLNTQITKLKNDSTEFSNRLGKSESDFKAMEIRCNKFRVDDSLCYLKVMEMQKAIPSK